MEFKEQELNFQQIVEASPTALILANSKGRIIYINDSATRMFGYEKRELEGKDMEILLENVHQKYSQNYWDEYFIKPDPIKHGEVEELLARSKSGKEFPVEIIMKPVKTDNSFYILNTITSISEQAEAIEQLRLIIESALNAMILTDSYGRIVMANKQTELLFGYARSELTGEKIEILVPQRMKQHHPHHREKFYAHPKARPMGAGRDLYAIKKDGTEIPVEIGLNPVERNGAHYVLASVIDITERKKDEESIQRYTREIEEKNKELEEFAHAASHDLREPLNSIISLTEILVQRKSEQLDEDGIKMLTYIDKSASRMTELISGLLEFAQLGNSKELVLTDLNELLKIVLLDLEAAIKTSGARINQDELPVIKVYDMEFRLLLQNLISNALKYRKKDISPVISVSSKRIRKGWEFSIADNGIGIPEGQKEKIFTLFHRLHGKSEYEGTGIGLAHCRKIIELHRGKIWVESILGEGSTFYFFIPDTIS